MLDDGTWSDLLGSVAGPTRTQLSPHIGVSDIDWMLYFTFRFEGYEDCNGDYVLISIDGTKGNLGVTWEWEVDARVGIPINKYIPKNDVAVFFTLVPVYLDPRRLLNNE